MPIHPVVNDSVSFLPITRSSVKSIAERLLAIYDPEAVRMFSFFETPPTHQREKNYLQQMRKSKTDELFAIVLKSEGVIGTIGLHEIDEQQRDARLGILIWNRAFHGKGTGSAAIRLLLEYAFRTRPRQLSRIYLTVFKTNHPAQALYRRLGFNAETMMCNAYQLRKRKHDLLRMTICRTEWLLRCQALGKEAT